jgi:hypothetical protein
MEAYEQFVALSLESRGFVVAGPLKFPVRIVTRKQQRHEEQTHGFEVDIVGSRKDKLVLATVKSFFGSRGVVADHVTGVDVKHGRLYALLNDENVRTTVLKLAAARFGYGEKDVEFHFYVGRFASLTNEERIREWWQLRL